MADKQVDSAILALLDTIPSKEAKWMGQLFESGDAASTFSVIDSELFGLSDGASQSLLVTSTVRGEGRTSLAVILGVFSAVAHKDRKILLVDADFGNPGLANIFCLEGHSGLLEYVAGKAEIDECVARTAIENLWVTPFGQSQGSANLLSPYAFEKFMEEAKSTFDLVVIDGAASSSARSILSIAKIARRSLLVIRCSGPTREQIRSFKNELERTGSDVLGCVLNHRRLVVPGFLYGSH